MEKYELKSRKKEFVILVFRLSASVGLNYFLVISDRKILPVTW
jgi:hypothetical protein